MEPLPLPTADSQSWAEDFHRSLSLQRDRVRQFLAAQRKRLDRAEQQLAERLRTLSDELNRNRGETRRTEAEIGHRREQLAREAENLESLKGEFDAARQSWEQFQHRAQQQQEALAEQIRHQQDELGRRHDELLKRQSETAAAEARLHQQQRDLETARGEYEADVEQLARQRTSLDEERVQFRQNVSEEHAERLEALQAERDALVERLAEAETGLAAAGQDNTADEDLRRRHEMALDDIRQLKAQNAELQQRLDEAATATSEAPVSAGGTADWESQKQRILDALEADPEEDDQDGEDATARRLEIEEVVESTNRLVAEKDREIEQLTQLLEKQSSNIGSVAVGAAALGEIVDSDAVVQEERENLKRVQQEWREKLRKAEIDISVERAKIARQWAEIEEKLRHLEEQSAETEAASGSSSESDRPVRGRWLARLGLKDLGED